MGEFDFQDIQDEVEGEMEMSRDRMRVFGEDAKDALDAYSEVTVEGQQSLLDDDFVGVIQEGYVRLTPEAYEKFSKALGKDIEVMTNATGNLEEELNKKLDAGAAPSDTANILRDASGAISPDMLGAGAIADGAKSAIDSFRKIW